MRLATGPTGVKVEEEWSGLSLSEGEVLAHLRRSIAGAPSIALDHDEVTAHDDEGTLELNACSVEVRGEEVTQWVVARETRGAIRVSYLARPIEGDSLTSHPPLELRHERAGFSAALKCLLLLPPDQEGASFELGWSNSTRHSSSGHLQVRAASSLGEVDEHTTTATGTGLDLLAHTFAIWADGPIPHHRHGQASTWWLTEPAFDAEQFTRDVGEAHRVMALAFGATATPFRVFVRASPHRGLNASAHPASFVMALNPDGPVDEGVLQRTVTHELVHEWVHLDGPAEHATWFNEGAADYFSLTLSLRHGLIDKQTFLREVNTAARLGYASPFRDLSLQEAARLYWSDFRVHRLPHVRGMFYLADLDARLRSARPSTTLDAVVAEVIAQQRAGNEFGLDQWCGLLDGQLGGDESAVLNDFVFAGHTRPGRAVFGPVLTMRETEVPVLDPGFDASTFPTGKVIGLRADGLAARAGLCDGEPVHLPTYAEAVNLDIDEPLVAHVTRDGCEHTLNLSLGHETVHVPQWRAD